MKALPATLALLAALITAGCGGGSADEPAATATAPQVSETAAAPSETAAPTPTSVPITVEEASASYLALAEHANAVGDVFNAAVDSDDMAQMRTAATANADALRTFVDGLVASEWPPEVQPAIDKLVSETAAEIPLWASVGASATDDDFWWTLNQIPATNSAQEVRVLLGLENVPVG